MGNITNTLRKLLLADSLSSSTKGRVQSVSGSTLYVVTSKGVQPIVNATATLYNEGDEVRVQNGMVLGRITKQKDLPVYWV